MRYEHREFLTGQGRQDCHVILTQTFAAHLLHTCRSHDSLYLCIGGRKRPDPSGWPTNPCS